MNERPVLLWFRQDLRLFDNPALSEAASRGAPVIPVYILAPETESGSPGAAARWWLHHSLTSLGEDLRKRNSRLIFRRGPAADVINQLVKETDACAVFWNRRYEPFSVEMDAGLKSDLKRRGVDVQSFNSALLREPWEIQNKSGKPFQIFTPFWRECSALPPPKNPLPPPESLNSPSRWPASESLSSWGLLPKLFWADSFSSYGTPGETAAQEKWKRFLRTSLSNYPEKRNLPGSDGCSRLSPHLHFGEIGPRQVWWDVNTLIQKQRHPASLARAAQVFLNEIGWREFAHHVLFYFPHTVEKPLRPGFNQFSWKKDPAGLRAWQQGRTGFPIVDAGMRELWATGSMHNRVRMIVASFLVKDLLISWNDGAAWFWDTLVDADAANNSLNWQWSAGCGADAAPYFRIFNPVNQGEKFDADGVYVRRWVPELKKMPARWIHRPWEAPDPVRLTAGVELGRHYPYPIVNHAEARQRALLAFKRLKDRLSSSSNGSSK